MVVTAKSRKRQALLSDTGKPNVGTQNKQPAADQHGTARRHPISRWYLMPLVRAVSAALARSIPAIRPAQITLLGLCFAAVSVAILFFQPSLSFVAAWFVLAAWFCDRLDGLFARMTNTASAWGGWLDANVDELVDLATQTALAAAAARLSDSQLPWMLLIAFLVGKYLFIFGLNNGRQDVCNAAVPTASADKPPASPSLIRRLYHLPGNADIRVHLLVIALLSGCLTFELALVAAYYNLRWIASYLLVARRLGGVR